MKERQTRREIAESPMTVVEVKREMIMSLGAAFTQDLWPYVNANSFVRRLYWRRLRSILERMPERVETLLDLGTGAGLFLPTYSRLSGTVLACDRSINPLAPRLLEATNCDNVHLARSDARSLCVRAESVDVIVAANVLEHIPDLAQVLEEIRRILKAGGLLICVSPFENALRFAARVVLRKDRPDHVRDARGVMAEISRYLEVLDARNLPWNSMGSLSFFQIVTARRD
jgi:ubiquinone/menaquinone biosynthesis C-methylase UbiE